jgi:uncharacterized membrane protein
MRRRIGWGAVTLALGWTALYLTNSFLAVLAAAVLFSYLMSRDED